MLETILIASIVVFVAMTITWMIQLKTKNAGIVDATWSYNFLLIGIVLMVFQPWALHSFIAFILLAAWSIRLGTYLFIRNVGKKEDERYTQLREEWGAAANVKMLLFFYLQAVLNVILCLPFYFIFSTSRGTLTPLEIIAVIVFIIALSGEALADSQLKRFKKNPVNKGKVCDVGLWNYSRHPNYFFEWMIWVSFFLYALSSPHGYWAILSPIIILWILIKATGIPMTEIQAIKSKGDLYREYQRTTSSFIPWFKKKND